MKNKLMIVSIVLGLMEERGLVDALNEQQQYLLLQLPLEVLSGIKEALYSESPLSAKLSDMVRFLAEGNLDAIEEVFGNK